MIDAYLTMASVFGGWALGFFDFGEAHAAPQKKLRVRAAEFLTAFAFGLFWPLVIIAAPLAKYFLKNKAQDL